MERLAERSPQRAKRMAVGAMAGAILHLVLSVPFAPGAFAQARSPELDQKLQQRLKKFPEADTNGDGVLTEAEARAHQQKRKAAKPVAPAAPAASRTMPSLADVRYGHHARNVLDVWPARSDRPAPVLVFFHGGSFKAGDKSMVLARPIFSECLNAGIAIVSANYRFSSDAPFPAPMHDGARVVQFIRSKAAEWNLDPTRIAVSGTSAGATLALWIALHDDLADPHSDDPVARQSSRVCCATPHSGTAGLQPEYFEQHAGVTKLGAALYQLFGASGRADLDAPDKRALLREASPLSHATRDDPPLFLTYAGDPAEAPFRADAPQAAWIHHVALGLPLKSKYDALGRACEIYWRSKPPPPGAELAFLKRHLFSGEAGSGAGPTSKRS